MCCLLILQLLVQVTHMVQVLAGSDPFRTEHLILECVRLQILHNRCRRRCSGLSAMQCPAGVAALCSRNQSWQRGTAGASRKAAARAAPALVIHLENIWQDGDANLQGCCVHIACCKSVGQSVGQSVGHGPYPGAEPTAWLVSRCHGALVQLLQAAVVVEDVSLHASVGPGGRLLAALHPAAGTLRALDFTLKPQDNVRSAKLSTTGF